MRTVGSNWMQAKVLLARVVFISAVTLGLTIMLLVLPAASASAADGVGVHRDGRFLLRESASGGIADRSFVYGRATDEPLVGDWNGDGAVTVGVRRGSRFFLRNSNSGGAADLSFHYGRAGDEVVVGDFNGDGRDTVGVRRGARFFLRNSNSGGPANVVFQYGRAGDAPLVGDWNGSGVDTVGVRRGARFFLRNSNSGGPANRAFHYGRAADAPLVGRWTAPVTTTIGEFTTPLVPGQARNTNIHLAADIIDGDVIAPGSTYALDQAIGPRTSARGFVANGFIDSDGDLISVVGGGVSQMGTTFLNAAWFAGIDLVAFRQHSIYFERYPMCREATLQRNVLDVVVVNDTPHPITISTSHTSSSVTVGLIGVPWGNVSSWIGDPYNVVGGAGGAFSVNCGRTVTYPDGSSSSATYTWRYDEGFPG